LERRLVDDLLDLTRIARGKLKLELKPIDAHEAIEQVIEMCRSELDTKALRLQLKLGARDAHVAADPARFRQIIWNLLKNAIKFTPAKGEITIVSANDESHELSVTVRDTGIGIEPALIDRIFNAFQQGDQSGPQRHGGLGLGLTISKAIAEGHRASLVVASDGRNRGTSVRLTMAVVSSLTALATAEGTDEAVASRRVFRILLVEDHADTSEALGRLLVLRGHSVGVAHDVRSALELGRRDPFDLVISDISLPDGTGVELMTQLRASGMRGIAISGFGMSGDLERSKAVGFAEHLVKPLSLEKLEAAIDRTMNTAL
jgi:two-component system, chemotaxis family, CheB/CheR fusion protein